MGLVRHRKTLLLLALIVIALIAASASIATAKSGGKGQPVVLADQGFFYVGGQEVNDPTAAVQPATVLNNEIYVEYQIPKNLNHIYPLVLVHGGGGQGLDWKQTPDGRNGWADYFLAAGYAVYTVDRPGYGRSPNNTNYGLLQNTMSAETFEKMFTAPQDWPSQYPRAILHNQWPGSGRMGDPIFDQFLGTQNPGPTVSNVVLQQAAAALLDRIGPAIIMTHSAGGPFGWLVADARPDLVKGIVAIEPSANFAGTGAGHANGMMLTYDPAITSTADLAEVAAQPDDPVNDLPGVLQVEPARKLVNYAGLPVLVVAAEASSMARSAEWPVKWINQAGGSAELLRLQNVGIHGNGHMMMIEKNNAQIVPVLLDWISSHIEKH